MTATTADVIALLYAWRRDIESVPIEAIQAAKGKAS